MERNRTILLVIAACSIVLLCCLCALLVSLGGAAFSLLRTTPGEPPRTALLSTPTNTPEVRRPALVGTPLPVRSDTAATLEEAIVPINDLRDLARRLEGKQDIPLTVPGPAEPLQAGEEASFWVSNVDTNENFQINATLAYVTDHLYFWVQEGVRYNTQALEALADTFENKIYPTNQEFFGSEWTPGVDNDPHLYILYARGIGASIAGYFSSVDEYHPLAHEYSNAHEMFLLSADNLGLEEEFTYGVLAHEFQHMIHWHLDRNEETWLNEGFSELAAFLNGYDLGGFDFAYSANPDLQLNDWPNDPSQTTPHYGASFLFLTYFLDRFGEAATQALVADPANGMGSVDDVLAEIGAFDPLSGEPIRADDVFVDWVLASFLQDPRPADGRYTYHNYSAAPQPFDTEQVGRCPAGPLTRDVHQYGVDYIRIDCSGDYTLEFEGSTRVPVVPQNPYSGSYAFWSNRGDESDMTLTRMFDFRAHSGPLTLSYWTWYDLEEDYDYLYLEASLDGENWQILTTPSGTAEDPSGNSYGWGYNGLSGGGPAWIEEQVDLTPFAGQQVQIRFEYITDAAVNGEGFLLDDVSIPEIGYWTDFEADAGGWEAAGFVRIQNELPQTFRLALITVGETITITQIPLSTDNTAKVPLALNGDIDHAILVVTGTTRATRQLATYRFSITP